MTPVLFLDMDGVVLSGRELWRTHNNRYMPPEKIAMIREICERTGCLVVVSSTWRYSDDTRDALTAAGIPLHRDWKTPVGGKHGAVYIGSTRGTEIHRWLGKNGMPPYAIVDDDSDMLPEQMDRFVKTPFETGIDREHVERLVSILA